MATVICGEKEVVSSTFFEPCPLPDLGHRLMKIARANIGLCQTQLPFDLLAQ